MPGTSSTDRRSANGWNAENGKTFRLPYFLSMWKSTSTNTISHTLQSGVHLRPFSMQLDYRMHTPVNPFPLPGNHSHGASYILQHSLSDQSSILIVTIPVPSSFGPDRAWISRQISARQINKRRKVQYSRSPIVSIWNSLGIRFSTK